jgi:hypothetical protein
MKSVASQLQFLTEILKVIDFAVEGKTSATFFIIYRLVAAGRVDNAKASYLQTQCPVR